jgi:hypothetical protein
MIETATQATGRGGRFTGVMLVNWTASGPRRLNPSFVRVARDSLGVAAKRQIRWDDMGDKPSIWECMQTTIAGFVCHGNVRIDGTASRAGNFAKQPCFGQFPVAFNRLWRNSQSLGCLFDAQAAEVA